MTRKINGHPKTPNHPNPDHSPLAPHESPSSGSHSQPSQPSEKPLRPRSLLAQVDRLSSQINQGDTQAAEELGRLLRQHPSLIERLGGDLPRNVESLFSAEISGEVASIRAAIVAHLDQWREELSAETASPLERMLVTRLISDWLVVYALDQQAAAQRFASPREAHPLSAAQDRAHRRLLASAKTLATIRNTTAARPAPRILDAQMPAEQQGSALRMLESENSLLNWLGWDD